MIVGVLVAGCRERVRPEVSSESSAEAGTGADNGQSGDISIAGPWTIIFETENGDVKKNVRFKQDGSELTMLFDHNLAVSFEGELDGRQIFVEGRVMNGSEEMQEPIARPSARMAPKSVVRPMISMSQQAKTCDLISGW